VVVASSHFHEIHRLAGFVGLLYEILAVDFLLEISLK
jgi:hypothetical protein